MLRRLLITVSLVGFASAAHAAPVAIAVSSHYSPSIASETSQCSPQVLLYDGTTWAPGTLPVTARCNLLGAVYSDSQTVWAYGTEGAGAGGMLLRSQDGGISWTDDSGRLPGTLQRGIANQFELVSVGFATSQRGWVVAKATMDGGLAITSTTDGGGHWSDLRSIPGNPFAGDYRIFGTTHGPVLLTLGAAPDIANMDSIGAFGRLPTSAPFETHDATGTTSGLLISGAEVSAESGKHSAAVALLDPTNSRVAHMTTLQADSGAVTAIGARGDAVIACGYGETATGVTAACWRSKDAGTSWEPSLVTGDAVEGGIPRKLVLADRSLAFAVLYSPTKSGSWLLQSNDAGANWVQLPNDLTNETIIRGLATTPEPSQGKE